MLRGDVFQQVNGNGAVGLTRHVNLEARRHRRTADERCEYAADQNITRITELAASGAYDGVVFHRVMDGFMAQTGDVLYGKSGADTSRAGMGGSNMPDVPAEFSDIPFDKGVVGMARSQSPDSANSQFFIMFDAGYFLNGEYTVVGRVTDGQDVVDAIKRGTGGNGAVIGTPDVMQKVTVID